MVYLQQAADQDLICACYELGQIYYNGQVQGKLITQDVIKAKELFERADFVKFAKFTATKEENASVLPQAVRFVTSTYQAEVEEEAENGEQEAPAEDAPQPQREERAEDYMPK